MQIPVKYSQRLGTGQLIGTPESVFCVASLVEYSPLTRSSRLFRPAVWMQLRVFRDHPGMPFAFLRNQRSPAPELHGRPAPGTTSKPLP